MNTVPGPVQSLVILAISLGMSITAMLLLRTFAPQWCVEHKVFMSMIIGAAAISPCVFVVFRMRKPA